MPSTVTMSMPPKHLLWAQAHTRQPVRANAGAAAAVSSPALIRPELVLRCHLNILHDRCACVGLPRARHTLSLECAIVVANLPAPQAGSQLPSHNAGRGSPTTPRDTHLLYPQVILARDVAFCCAIGGCDGHDAGEVLKLMRIPDDHLAVASVSVSDLLSTRASVHLATQEPASLARSNLDHHRHVWGDYHLLGVGVVCLVNHGEHFLAQPSLNTEQLRVGKGPLSHHDNGLHGID